MRAPLTISHEAAAKRWPRLLAACSWAALLTHTEAACCLRDYAAGRRGSGEAVDHFGGCAAVLARAAAAGAPRRAALRARAYLRRLDAERAFTEARAAFHAKRATHAQYRAAAHAYGRALQRERILGRA